MRIADKASCHKKRTCDNNQNVNVKITYEYFADLGRHEWVGNGCGNLTSAVPAKTSASNRTPKAEERGARGVEQGRSCEMAKSIELLNISWFGADNLTVSPPQKVKILSERRARQNFHKSSVSPPRRGASVPILLGCPCLPLFCRKILYIHTSTK